MKDIEPGIAVPFTIDGKFFACEVCKYRGHIEEEDDIAGWGYGTSGVVVFLIPCPKCGTNMDIRIQTTLMTKEERMGFDGWMQERFS